MLRKEKCLSGCRATARRPLVPTRHHLTTRVKAVLAIHEQQQQQPLQWHLPAIQTALTWSDGQTLLAKPNTTLAEVVSTLQPIVAPCVEASSELFPSEPVVQAFEDVVQSIAMVHQTYDHIVYDPVITAANDTQTSVFLALQWVLQHKATMKISRGVAIEKVGLDGSGKVCLTSSMRTMLWEERAAVVVDYRSSEAPKLDPALLALKVLGGPKPRASKAAMSVDGDIEAVASAWFSSWSAPGHLDLLPLVMSDGVKTYDGMGLHTRPSVGCEGMLLSYSSRWEAEQAIQALHQQWLITDALLTDVAVSQEGQAIFCEWQATARSLEEDAEDDSPSLVQGLALLLLDRAGLIHQVLQFVRMPKNMWHVPIR